MDVLEEVGKPLLHERIDVAELDVVRSLKTSVLVLAQDDVGNALVILMWWTMSEVLQDSAR